VVIGIAIVNAMANETTSLGAVLFVNAIILVAAFVLEFIPGLQGQSSIQVLYDDLSLLQDEKSESLKADIAARTGLSIQRYTIDHVDLLKQTARITVYY